MKPCAMFRKLALTLWLMFCCCSCNNDYEEPFFWFVGVQHFANGCTAAGGIRYCWCIINHAAPNVNQRAVVLPCKPLAGRAGAVEQGGIKN